MRVHLLFAVIALAACHAELVGDGSSNGAVPDANNGGGGGGGGGMIDAAVSPDAPMCMNGRVVYLNFDGQALTAGTPSNATTNRASWMQIANGSAPPYRAQSANRAADIMAITTGIRAQLSQFPVTVVTTRPATGPYVMVVFGGTANQVGSRFGGAVNALDCGDVATKSDVAWISDGISPNQRVINFAIGAIGFGLGLSATTDPLDCMCGWDNACESNNAAACKLGGPIARDPNANQRCPGLTTQDEPATFNAAFCQ
ncbi:MAG: hypothetical protein H0T46_04765 [Deltaproteobacteria bacterium]|nr:hypothetical protein [Deltaproteobacteria bacterium]